MLSSYSLQLISTMQFTNNFCGTTRNVHKLRGMRNLLILEATVHIQRLCRNSCLTDMLHCFKHSSSSSTPCHRMKFSPTDSEHCATVAPRPANIHWVIQRNTLLVKHLALYVGKGRASSFLQNFFLFLEHPRQTHAGIKIPLLSHVKVALCLLSHSSASAGTCCHFCHNAFTTTWAGVLLTHYFPCSTAFTHPTGRATAILLICAQLKNSGKCWPSHSIILLAIPWCLDGFRWSLLHIVCLHMYTLNLSKQVTVAKCIKYCWGSIKLFEKKNGILHNCFVSQAGKLLGIWCQRAKHFNLPQDNSNKIWQQS